MCFDRAFARRWWASLALLLPVIALYAAEYGAGDGRTFTGFIQYDQPYYMANARMFFSGGFHFLYGNPFSPDPATARIYFQVHLFVLGLVQKITGWDPGTIYVGFGFVAALVAVRVALALYEQIAGLETTVQWAGLVLFIWGGGVLALTGLLFHVAEGSDFRTTVTHLFDFDPAQGWWFLNFGRNLVFPTEAYYHALALGAVLTAMRGNYRASLWLAFLLSLSHPFTGLQFLLILLAWSGVELGLMRNKAIPFAYPALLLCLLLSHVAYNLFLLNLFPEHRVLFLQWSLDWGESIFTFVPAYLLVGFFAWRAMRTLPLAWALWANPANRLLAVWFVVSFVLVHHDAVIAARQPLHFERGYTWIPLVLLGVQPLLAMLRGCYGLQNIFLKAAALVAIFLVGLSDNLAWFGLHGAMALAPRLGITWLAPDGFRLATADRELYAWLKQRPGAHAELLITPDTGASLVYLAMVYTDYRSWYSHYASTPFANQRKAEVEDFFRSGAIPTGWNGRTILVIVPKENPWTPSTGLASNPVYENEAYRVWKMRVP